MYVTLINDINWWRKELVFQLPHITQGVTVVFQTDTRCATKSIIRACAEMVQQLVVYWQTPKTLPQQLQHIPALLLQHQALVLLASYWRLRLHQLAQETIKQQLTSSLMQWSPISADMASQLGITWDNTEQVVVTMFASQIMPHQKWEWSLSW